MRPVRALYVHVPFCHTICGYCDFYSVVYDRNAAGPLVDALLRELEHYRRNVPLQVETVFIGGGTPTTLPAGHLRRLLAGVRRVTTGNGRLEFTVEANPATMTRARADALVEAGVNRLSIGAQSFRPADLRVLERIHRPEDVPRTIDIARRVGIQRINLDLIFAVPGQRLDDWLGNLRRAVALGVEHLSCYALTYEPGTPLFERLQRGALRRTDADLEAEMYEATVDYLTQAGFEQYEISNFARPGCACRHNLTYWHNEPYVGIGPSAAGYIDGQRYRNVADLAAYIRQVSEGRSPRAEAERRTGLDVARETAMLELRLREGIDRRRFARRFGVDPCALFAAPIERYREPGLLEVDERAIRLTRRGLLVADTIIAEFL